MDIIGNVFVIFNPLVPFDVRAYSIPNERQVSSNGKRGEREREGEGGRKEDEKRGREEGADRKGGRTGGMEYCICSVISNLFILRDKLNKDDFIGTGFLSLTDISAAGDNGESPSLFLPLPPSLSPPFFSLFIVRLLSVYLLLSKPGLIVYLKDCELKDAINL